MATCERAASLAVRTLGFYRSFAAAQISAVGNLCTYAGILSARIPGLGYQAARTFVLCYTPVAELMRGNHGIVGATVRASP